MHIDEILNSIHSGENVLIPESWAQGRTTFGGLTAAILCQATSLNVDPSRRLRNFEVGFVRPLEALKPYEISVETLANGKTVTIKSARIIQEGKVRATARADYVLPLESDVKIDTFTAPNLKQPEASIALEGDHLPNFFNYFDGHVATAGIPFSGEEVPELGGWVKFKEAPQAISDAHLVCMIDAWPPTASPHYIGFKPLSTISWSIHFANSASRLSPEDYLGYHAKVNFGEQGISSSNAEIWGADGQLLATSVQTNIIYG